MQHARTDLTKSISASSVCSARALNPMYCSARSVWSFDTRGAFCASNDSSDRRLTHKAGSGAAGTRIGSHARNALGLGCVDAVSLQLERLGLDHARRQVARLAQQLGVDDRAACAVAARHVRRRLQWHAQRAHLSWPSAGSRRQLRQPWPRRARRALFGTRRTRVASSPAAAWRGSEERAIIMRVSGAQC